MNEKEIKKAIFEAIDLLPDQMDQSAIMSTLLTITDAYAETEEEMAMTLAMTFSLYTAVNKLNIDNMAELLKEAYKMITPSFDKGKMN